MKKNGSDSKFKEKKLRTPNSSSIRYRRGAYLCGSTRCTLFPKDFCCARAESATLASISWYGCKRSRAKIRNCFRWRQKTGPPPNYGPPPTSEDGLAADGVAIWRGSPRRCDPSLPARLPAGTLIERFDIEPFSDFQPNEQTL